MGWEGVGSSWIDPPLSYSREVLTPGGSTHVGVNHSDEQWNDRSAGNSKQKDSLRSCTIGKSYNNSTPNNNQGQVIAIIIVIK